MARWEWCCPPLVPVAPGAGVSGTALFSWQTIAAAAEYRVTCSCLSVSAVARSVGGSLESSGPSLRRSVRFGAQYCILAERQPLGHCSVKFTSQYCLKHGVFSLYLRLGVSLPLLHDSVMGASARLADV